MDDLSSVEWAARKPAPARQQNQPALGNYYPALRPTPPISGTSTPSGLQPNTKAANNPPSRSNASTPANDSFANLVSFNTSQADKGLSLQDQQRKLHEANLKRDEDKRKALNSQFGAVQATAWDSLGNGRTTPNRLTSPPTYTATSEYGGQKLSQVINRPFANIPVSSTSNNTRTPTADEDDILAAFNSSAPVDKSSHMPDPSRSSSIESSGVVTGSTANGVIPSLEKQNGLQGGFVEDLDDDPFGLGTNGHSKSSGGTMSAEGATVDDTDDVLGLLGRPLSEFAQKPVVKSRAPEASGGQGIHPQERAVAELVDMGFDPERSRIALETTASGTDVQSAVGWLLNQAHEDSRNKKMSHAQGNDPDRATKSPPTRRAPGRRKSSSSGAATPAWMREQPRSNVDSLRPDSKSPVNGEKDPAQYASEIGNKMFKTAGSLWKTGTKKLNQAVQEFNSDSDSTQPKWMKDSQTEVPARKVRAQQRESDTNDHDRPRRRAPLIQEASVLSANVTDEALMLEADSRPLRKPRVGAEHSDDSPHVHRERSPAFTPKPREQVVSPQPKFMQQAPSREPKAKLSRQTIEDETSQAYISPARRKRPTPKVAVSEPERGPEPDLLLGTAKPASASLQSRPKSASQPRISPPASLPSRPIPTKRNIPYLSPFALQASTKERQEGNLAFKRGDYAQSTTHYSTSLSAIPATHPLAIVVLTNRAVSNSKTGDAKASLADARSALETIGPSRGANETIEIGGGEGSKQLSLYWEKAMTRQAEALEHLERWADAAAIWRTCVEAGVGGAASIAGRNRSEKAAAPPSRTKPPAPGKGAVKSRPKPTALGDFAPDSQSVTRLRAANAAADRLDDEKFALADVVDARVSRWRAGKEGNLRALLSTLENVLWSDSGWKKVGMGDVLLPGKVKVIYMKGIAKVHPDKLSITASTEQKMISAAVFATLNEAWERFKMENGL